MAWTMHKRSLFCVLLFSVLSSKIINTKKTDFLNPVNYVIVNRKCQVIHLPFLPHGFKYYVIWFLNYIQRELEICALKVSVFLCSHHPISTRCFSCLTPSVAQVLFTIYLHELIQNFFKSHYLPNKENC
jgi:hypothetical protein